MEAAWSGEARCGMVQWGPVCAKSPWLEHTPLSGGGSEGAGDPKLSGPPALDRPGSRPLTSPCPAPRLTLQPLWAWLPRLASGLLLGLDPHSYFRTWVKPVSLGLRLLQPVWPLHFGEVKPAQKCFSCDLIVAVVTLQPLSARGFAEVLLED